MIKTVTSRKGIVMEDNPNIEEMYGFFKAKALLDKYTIKKLVRKQIEKKYKNKHIIF